MCTLVSAVFFGNDDNNHDSTCLCHWTVPDVLMNHVIAATMTSLTANRNQVLRMKKLLFSFERFFTCESSEKSTRARVFIFHRLLVSIWMIQFSDHKFFSRFLGKPYQDFTVYIINGAKSKHPDPTHVFNFMRNHSNDTFFALSTPNPSYHTYYVNPYNKACSAKKKEDMGCDFSSILHKEQYATAKGFEPFPITVY